MTLPSERRNVPFRSLWGTDWHQPHEMLSHRQAKEGGEGFWDAEQLDGDRASRWIPHIASQPFLPTQTIMCALCTGEGQRRDSWIGGESRLHLDLQVLAVQLQTCSPMLPSAPVTPKQRSRAHGKRVQQHTHAGSGFLVALPCHWHCTRLGQGRQLRMLAAYTTRRLLSASLRRSWATSDWPAGQRKVPSG